MTQVRPFNRDMIEAALKALNLKYEVDEDNHYVLRFNYDEDARCAYVVYAGADGSRGDILWLSAILLRKVERGNWGRAILACNLWNRDMRWPKSYLATNEDDGTGHLVAEKCYDLEKGVHQDWVNFTVRQMIGATFSFGEHIQKHHGWWEAG